MFDFLFVVKMFVATIIIVLLLQIKLGDNTVEDHAMYAIRASPVASWVQDAGAGGWSAIRNGLNVAMSSIKRFIKSSDSPGSRQEVFSVKRSERFLKEQAAKLESKAQQAESELDSDISE